MAQFIENRAVATSEEFMFSINEAIRTRAKGMYRLSSQHARTAELMVRSALPDIEDAIGRAASRKGNGATIGRYIADIVSPVEAAAIAAVWILRSARQPALEAINRRFGANPEFRSAFRMLFRNVYV